MAGCVLSLLLGFGLTLLGVWLQQNQHWQQQRRLHYLETEITRIDTRLKAAPTLRADVVELQNTITRFNSLNASRSQTLRLLLLLATSWVENINCQNMHRFNGALTLTGNTTGNGPVAKLMSNLEKTGAFALIKVNHIHGQGGREDTSNPTNTESAYSFEARLKLYPEAATLLSPVLKHDG